MKLPVAPESIAASGSGNLIRDAFLDHDVHPLLSTLGALTPVFFDFGLIMIVLN